MSETLLSILCDEDFWYWDSNNANTISFEKNGTGEVSLFRVLRLCDIAKQTEVSMSSRAEHMDRCRAWMEVPEPWVGRPGRRHQQQWRHSQGPASYQPVWHRTHARETLHSENETPGDTKLENKRVSAHRWRLHAQDIHCQTGERQFPYTLWRHETRWGPVYTEICTSSSI